jgi:hypothetical protein
MEGSIMFPQSRMKGFYKSTFPNISTCIVHLAKQFQRRRFLEIDQSETRIACGSHVCKRIAPFQEGVPGV